MADNRNSGSAVQRRARIRFVAVWTLTGFMALLGTWVALSAVRLNPSRSGHLLAWPALTAAMLLISRYPVRIHVSHHTHSLDLLSLPVIVGALLLRPDRTLIAALIGTVLDQLITRHYRPTQMAFNVANQMLGVAVLVWVITLTGAARQPFVPQRWLDVAAAILIFEVQTGAGVALVMAVVGEAPGRRYLSEVGLQIVLLVPVVGILAVVAVEAYRSEPWTLALLPGPVIGLALWYGWAERLRARFSDMRSLYGFSAALAGAREKLDVLSVAMAQTAEILRCHHVELCTLRSGMVSRYHLSPAGTMERREDPVGAAERRLFDNQAALRASAQEPWVQAQGWADCLVAPVTVPGEAPALLVAAERRGDNVSTFGDEDLVLLQALASHLGIALTACAHLDRLRSEVEAREHQAFHDPLTGLANRSMLSNLVTAALTRRTGTQMVAVMLMDLNGFKEINDTLGHHTGDEVLKALGARLEAEMGASRVAARLGGDEFAFLIEAANDAEEVKEVARRLVDAIAEPLEISGMVLSLRASMGLALAPFHGSECETLLRNADVAMYGAKRSNQRVAVYDPAADHFSTRRLRLASDLQRAVNSGGELDLWFQPIADLASGEVRGMEALMRWEHPDFGPIGPEEFIPVAEQTGLIESMTDWVIERSLAELRRLRSAGYDLTVSVNISARSLFDSSIVDRVVGLVETSGVPADRLTLEITESSVMLEFERSRNILDRLARAGVRIAIDDFGTGYSSLSRLKSLPVHVVKIDKSFIHNLCDDIGDQAIVRSTIELARIMRHTVVAEGVEDFFTWSHLAELGCHLAQGYYFARPMPAADCRRFLETAKVTVGAPKPMELPPIQVILP